MEARLNRIRAWLKNGSGDVREDARLLEAYYRSPLWRSDFEAEEAGRFPSDLPRGVLSEDAVYNVLTSFEERMRELSFETAVSTIPPGRYRHFKGNEYEVLEIARHSETAEPMVVYRALYGEHGLWVRPASMWNENVERGGKTYQRFVKTEDCPDSSPEKKEEPGE